MQPEVDPKRADFESALELAHALEENLLGAGLSDEDIAAGCRRALGHQIAALVVRPSDVDLASRLLEGSAVAAASVVGYPYGASTTAVKLYEARDLARRGARQLEVYLNTGKLLSRQFQHVETELLQVSRACRESGVLVSAVLDGACLAADLRLIALKIAKRCEVDFLSVVPGGAVAATEQFAFLKRALKGVAKLKAAGAVHSVDEALSAYQAGADRIATCDAGAILAGWNETRAEQRDSSPVRTGD